MTLSGVFSNFKWCSIEDCLECVSRYHCTINWQYHSQAESQENNSTVYELKSAAVDKNPIIKFVKAKPITQSKSPPFWVSVETTSAVLMISPMVYFGDIRHAYLFLLLTINGWTEITKNTKSAFKAIWVFQARTNLLFDSRYPGCPRKGRTKPKCLSDREATGKNAFCFLLSKQDLRISFLMYTSPKML